MTRPGAWIRRWGPALAGLAVPVAGIIGWTGFRSPEPPRTAPSRLEAFPLEVVAVPPGDHLVAAGAAWRTVASPGFRIGRTEVTVAQYCEYLNRSGTAYQETGQITRTGAAWTPRAGAEGRAVAWVTAASAEGFCAWLSGIAGARVRLPAAAEWEVAARAGGTAERAGGWKAGAARPATPPEAGAPPENGYGMAGVGGGLFEWCRDGEALTAMDSAWTEPTSDFATLHHRWTPPPDYADGDVGFRVLVEDGKTNSQ